MDQIGNTPETSRTPSMLLSVLVLLSAAWNEYYPLPWPVSCLKVHSEE